MDPNAFSTIIWITAILICSLSTIVFLGNNERTTRVFGICTLCVALWTISTGLIISSTNSEMSYICSKTSYFFSITIAVIFFYFFLIYPHNLHVSNKIKISLILFEILSFYYLFFTDKIIGPTFKLSSNVRWGWTFGSLSFLFDIFFSTFFLLSIYILYKKYKSVTNHEMLRKNILSMLIAIIVGIIPPFLTCNILPRIGYYDLDWLGPTTGVIWVFIIAYSIIKYRQMNVRTVATEVLALGMTIIFFLNIFIDVPLGLFGRIATFVVFLLLAIYLFRAIVTETKQREQLRLLNNTLEQKVIEQTREIRRAYDLEKHARWELEKLNETKDQFIMITQHNIRMPVSRARSYIEDIFSTTDEDLRDNKLIDYPLRDKLQNVKNSLDRLTGIVDDFLNITTLSVGSPLLHLKENDMKTILENTLQELKIDLEKKAIQVTFENNSNDKWPSLHIDASKMKEVFLIILENAIKYNSQNGLIKINRKLTEHYFEISIFNTGIGFTEEEKESILHKHYFRSDKAKKMNPIGMGIGLSVARAIMRAHHGELEIISLGSQKGACVMLRLPMVKERF